MRRKRRTRKISILLALVLCLSCVSGCSYLEDASIGNGTDTEQAGVSSVDNTIEKSTESGDKTIADNELLYANDDDTSVITMYLTVRQGNASEQTNHTWSEVNTYSAYDYSEWGVERYGVAGLLQVGDENGLVEGEFGYGRTIPNAKVTIRGQTSSRYSQKSYKIKLTDDAGRWNDQTTINLNKHQQDGVRFRNKLAYDLIENMPGMIALQTQFVHLYVKDETEGATDAQFTDYGFYTQVEQPNKSFLQRHGLDKNGELYKINFFEFYRYEDVVMLKNDADYDQTAFESMIEIKGNDDHSNLIAMLDELNDYTIPIETVLDNWFERDNLFSWLSFHILTGNVDTQSRNTLLYSPLNTDTFYFISWDCDVSFSRTEDQLRSEIATDGWDNGVSNYWGNVLFQRILKSDTLRAELDTKINEQRALLTEDKIREMVESYSAVVKSYAYSEPDLLSEPLTEEQYDTVCAAIPTEVEMNYQIYKESLERPLPFYIGNPVISENTVSFNWDASYDFDGEDMLYSFELADNLEFTNPLASGTDLFLTEYIYEGALAPGQYFVRVKSKNESGYEQYAFDYYVTIESTKVYGVKSFYVQPDGSVLEDIYEE